MKKNSCDVVIVGAGPSGSVAACLLRQQGFSVTILEQQQFPRFVIGESLLAQSLQTLEKAGLLDTVEQYGFQMKRGARFKLNDRISDIVFAEKFSAGPGYAYHVKRADFDLLLAEGAVKQGAVLHYRHTVTKVSAKFDDCTVDFLDANNQAGQIHCRFILDASGYGRLLPRLLKIDKPSTLPSRASLFTHIRDHIPADSIHGRDRTLITIHPQQHDLWFWLISFSDGFSSLGAVGDLQYLAPYQQAGVDGLKALVAEDPVLNDILKNAEYADWHKALNGYSGSVSEFYGDGFAVLGNAGEFLDPVFSSGVTAALYSADLASSVLGKALNGEPVNWQTEFSDALSMGIEVFRKYVDSWYDGSLQQVIFAENKNPKITEMIASILAGYAWDEQNPFVHQSQRLDHLAKLCAV